MVNRSTLPWLCLAATSTLLLSGCGDASASAPEQPASETEARADPLEPDPAPAPSPEEPDDAQSFVLGAQTHFSQGWDTKVLSSAQAVGAELLRDSLPWPGVEPVAGAYDLTGSAAVKAERACAQGHRFIMTAVPKHPAYDGGQLAYTPQAQRAFAAHLGAIADRFGKCIAAFEIGNEINSASGLKYPSGYDPEDTYVALLKAIREVVKPAHPHIAILGGSTNMIGTGFQERLFEAGMLPLVDGVAVHQYRPYGESTDLEIVNLRDVMTRHGGEVPIWVSEFSHDLSDQEEAAAQLLKTVTLMSASGVHAATWYALINQSHFPNMGLFAGSTIKPAGEALSLANSMLLPRGRASFVDLGAPLLFTYRFGDVHVVWGAERPLRLSASAEVTDYRGRPVAHSGEIMVSEDPVVISGAGTLTPRESPVWADTLLQFGRAGWENFALTADGKYHSLGWMNDQFDSYIGSRWHKPLQIRPYSAAPAGDGSSHSRAVWRHTASRQGQAVISACFSKQDKGDGVDVELAHNGKVVRRAVLSSGELNLDERLDIARGDRIEVRVGPNQTYGNDSFRYRARIVSGDHGARTACP